MELGHVRIPNNIMDALIAIRVPGQAMQVLLFIIRKTLGWNKKVDKISLSQFQEATGMQKHKIINARGKLLDMNIISVTQKGNEKQPSYGFNLDYDKWKPLPKRVIITQKGTAITQKGNKPLPKRVHTKDNKDTITKDNILVVFTFWNSKKIIIHSDIKAFTPEINARLKQYSVEEIKEAIDNYSKILFSDDYIFSYRWSLLDFLIRKKDNISRFLNRSKPFESFPRKKKERDPFEGLE